MKTYLVTIKRVFAKHKTAAYFSLATIIYTACTVFYLGGAVTNCTQTLMTFPGDNTAGMIALFSVDQSDPWYGRSDVFSYPYGELLGQPTHITAQSVFVPFWILAKLVGPICSFNLLQALGFVSTALLMFAFVRWLLKGKELVALVAGFAAAFTPYIQLASGVHISYVFGGVFIGAIWLFLLFWKDPTLKKMLALAASVALFGYTDGYFILLGGVLVAALIIGATGYELYSARSFTDALKKRLKLLGIGAVTAVAFLMPIFYVQFKSANEINTLLAESRNSIHAEAQVYGARPLEYILPNAMNPLTNGVFGTYEERDSHGSNPSENVLSISLAMLALAGFFIVRVVRGQEETKEQSVLFRMNPQFIAAVFAVVCLIAFMFSLPPKLGPIPTPSYLLIEAIQLWRVLARLGVIVNIAVVILGACGLSLLLQHVKHNGKRTALCLAVLVFVFLEYLTFVPPRHTEGYEQVPELYSWLKTQQSYNEIAEYPLEELGESEYPVFYNTYQRIHGKKLFNGIVKEKDPYFTRLALSDLKDPQTIPGLRTLGIDFLTIHSPTFPGEIDGLRFVHQSSEKKITTKGKANIVWGYAVEPGRHITYITAAKTGFHAPEKISPIESTRIMGHQGIFGVMKIGKGKNATSVQVRVIAKATDSKGQLVSIAQQGKETWRGVIPSRGMTVEFSVDPTQEYTITAIDPKVDATLKITELTVIE